MCNQKKYENFFILFITWKNININIKKIDIYRLNNKKTLSMMD